MMIYAFTLTNMTNHKKLNTMITVQNKIYKTGTLQSATVSNSHNATCTCLFSSKVINQ